MSLDDFQPWYVTREAIVELAISRAFKAVDGPGEGTISTNGAAALLERLNAHELEGETHDADVAAAISSLLRNRQSSDLRRQLPVAAPAPAAAAAPADTPAPTESLPNSARKVGKPHVTPRAAPPVSKDSSVHVHGCGRRRHADARAHASQVNRLANLSEEEAIKAAGGTSARASAPPATLGRPAVGRATVGRAAGATPARSPPPSPPASPTEATSVDVALITKAEFRQWYVNTPYWEERMK